MSDRSTTKWVPRDVRKANMSLRNRLQSIIHDSRFVQSLVTSDELARFPVIPNERCGLWYVPPSDFLDTAYFKSTDGHCLQWSFSTRRLNLHLWPLLQDHGGVTIIDSSRRKLIPDSLLKTVPIWCAVLNSILYADVTDSELEAELTSLGLCSQSALFSTVLEMHKNNWVQTPMMWVSPEERLEISARIGGFVADAVSLQLISKVKLLAALGGQRKPLIPRFFYPDGPTPDKCEESVYYINCVTASRKVSLAGVPTSLSCKEKLISWVYIQGAADDHELWITPDICEGNLDPKFFWNTVYLSENSINISIVDETTGYILDSLDEQELADELNRIWKRCNKRAETSLIDHTELKMGSADPGIILGSIKGDTDNVALEREFPGLKHVILFSTLFRCARTSESTLKIHQFQIDPTKKGAKMMRGIFEALVAEVGVPSPNNQVLILDSTGADICAGMALVFLCKYYDHDWIIQSSVPDVNKRTVKRHLAKLCEMRKINPSRNTLQSVHSFLIHPEIDPSKIPEKSS